MANELRLARPEGPMLGLPKVVLHPHLLVPDSPTPDLQDLRAPQRPLAPLRARAILCEETRPNKAQPTHEWEAIDRRELL